MGKLMLLPVVPIMTPSGTGPSSEFSAMLTGHISFSLLVGDSASVFCRLYDLLKTDLINFVGMRFESCLLSN